MKLVKDGLVAVLYSPGFGAGWSTWNTDYPELLFDQNIVHFIERGEFEEATAYCQLKYPDAYLGGMDGLRVEWLKEGTLFRIHEYDGNESIEVKEDMDWLLA